MPITQRPRGGGEPVLARARPAYSERPADIRLRRYAVAAWTYTDDDGSRRRAFVPHGFPDVLWIAGKPWLGGTYRHVVIEDGARDSAVVGIALRPGVIAAWTGIAAEEFVGVRLPLADVFPLLASRLMSAVADEREPAIIASRMEDTIAREFACIEPPAHSYTSILRALQPSPMTMHTTQHIARSLGASQRTLHRRCATLFGYGPKTLERILRMQRFLRLAQSSATAIATLAQAAGYSDQAHLTREARLLTGLTPKSIMAQLSAARAAH